MSRLRGLRRHPFLVVWLTVVWVALWGSATAANVLGGLAVSTALLVLLPAPELAPRARVRPLALLGLLGFFAVELVRATAVVAWQVLRIGRPLRQAVVAVELPGASDRMLTLVANAVSLTPGTLTLEVDRARSTLYVHALDVDGPDGAEAVRAAARRLRELAARAVPAREDAAVQEGVRA